MRIPRLLLSLSTLGLALLQIPALLAAPEKESFYIVLLQEKSLAEKVMEWAPEASPRERRALLFSARGRRYRDALEARTESHLQRFQARFQTSGLQPGRPKIHDHGATALNYLVVEGTRDQVESLGDEMPLRGIYPLEIRYLQTDSMPEFLHATEGWELLGGIDNAGAGVKIGLIDSGVNIHHPMFAADGLVPPEGYPLGDFPDQTNGKVIVARTYVKTEYALKPQPIQDPRDELGHGSRVGGIAAGSPVHTNLGFLRGIAPKAFLGIYKVFGDPGINATTTNAAVIAAVDDAVADGMDVINLSLGGPARTPENDPEQIAIKNASEAGVVFVIAAGNYGSQGTGSVTAPGTSPDALTVGSVSHGRLFRPRLTLTSEGVPLPDLSPLPYQPSQAEPPKPEEYPIGPLPLVDIADLDATEQACSPLPAGSVQGMVALVRRGNCFFSVKAMNVIDIGGAAGLLVYNNEPGRPISMDFEEELVTVPAVMIGKTSGEALSQFLQSQSPAGGSPVEVTFFSQNDDSTDPSSTLVPYFLQPFETNILSNFSGMGPSFDRIKPDLVSIGERVLSADRCQPNFTNCGIKYSNTASTQGTSFSTPAVSGAAALVRQLHPDWPSAWIRSAIVNSAEKTVTRNDEPATVNEAGNGRLNVLAALSAPAVLEPVSLNFGPQNLLSNNLSFRLTNVGSEAQVFQFSVQEARNDPQMELFVEPASVLLGAGESQLVSLHYDANQSVGPGFFEGYVRIASGMGTAGTGESPVLSISYWGSLVLETGGRMLEVAQDGSTNFNSIEKAIAVALPQDTIEVQGSEVYEENLFISTDATGLALNGLTLRAALGAHPIIRGNTQTPTLSVRGVSDITIQGLEFQGGNGTVELTDSSGVFRNNVLNGEATDSLGISLSLSNSHFHVFENQILGSRSTALALFNSSDALVQRNRLGSVTQPSAQHGFFAGTESRVALFENLVDSSGQFFAEQGGRQGVRFSSGASGLLRSNRITRSAGANEDGLLITGPGTSVDSRSNVISDHSRFGIWVLDQAQLDSNGDQVENNGETGVYNAPETEGSGLGGTVTLRRLQAYHNQNSVEVSQGQLTLSDSILAGMNRGIQLQSGDLQVSRSTIFGHSDVGIEVLGGTLAADHNIFSENLGGDVVGAVPGSLTFNLTDGLQTAGSNVQGLARFVDAANLNFSLSPDSDAIDRGDPSLCCLAGDLLFHSRIVDGNGDGEARLDMGALEYGSNHTPTLIAPILATDSSQFVGLALANASTPVPDDPETGGTPVSTSQVALQAFDSLGQPLAEELDLTVSPGTQTALLLGDQFPAGAGWVRILANQPDLVSFTLLGAGNLEFMDGAQLGPALPGPLILPQVFADEGAKTTLFLVNPEAHAQNVQITWNRAVGSDSSGSLILPPRGSIGLDVAQFFQPGNGGYLILEPESPLFAMEIFGDEDSRAGLAALPAASAKSILYGAQLATSPEIDTLINLINLGAATNVTLKVHAESGAELASAQVALAAGSQLSMLAGQLFDLGGTVDGWIEIEGDDQGLLLGNLLFGDPNGNSQAALPLQDVGAREFLLSQIAETPDIFTGLTLLNNQTGTALLTVEAFSPQGELLGRSFLRLGGGQKRAYLLTELMPQIVEQAGGFLRIRSSRQLLGFELFGNQSLSFLSAVPQQVVTP